jgi:perosamine synthetase
VIPQVIPRKKLDIGWPDLAHGLARCALPGNTRGHPSASARLREAFMLPGGDAIAALSVRSAFDALLTTLALPEGSEVLMSALTIADMPRIAREHGLVPVPVDMDIASLSVDMASLERAAGPRSRLLVVAHLFGARMPMDAVAAFARERGLLLVEDAAQAWAGDGWLGHPASDVALFSFGPIKTATTLAGAMARFRDPALAARVDAIQQRWPLQSRASYAARLAKYALLQLLASRPVYTLFVHACRLVGADHDRIVSGSVRGFAGPGFFARIRRRPCAPLLALMDARLASPRGRREQADALAGRIAHARRVHAALPPALAASLPGVACAAHTHWVLPLLHDEPDALLRELQPCGVDATRGASSLRVVEAPEGRAAAARTGGAWARLCYLPGWAAQSRGLSERDAARIGAALGTTGRKPASVRLEKVPENT